MDTTDMQLINDIYINLLKKGRHIYKESGKEYILSNAQKLESYSKYLSQMNDKLEAILDLTDKYSNECMIKANKIRLYIDINDRYKDDPSKMFLAHKKMHGNVSWGEVTEIKDKKNILLKNVSKIVKKTNSKSEYNQEPIIYKDISKIYGNDIGFECKIPIINKLNEMPSALYWYDGDKQNPKGVYICVSRKFYVQVPFPNVVNGTKDFNRTCSIKCKYNTEKECFAARRGLSNRLDSKPRECTFAHSGDKYIKIGSLFRCPNMPRFGSHSSLKDDLENLPDCDIKVLLMYSLSDVLLSSLWFQKQKNKNITFTNIDIC
jgi:hypothetical protein